MLNSLTSAKKRRIYEIERVLSQRRIKGKGNIGSLLEFTLSFPLFFRNSAGSYVQRLPYFRVSTSCMGNYEEKQRWLPNSFQEEGKQTVYGAFPLNDGADSTLVSLAKKPAFRLEKALL